MKTLDYCHYDDDDDAFNEDAIIDSMFGNYDDPDERDEAYGDMMNSFD